MQTVGFCIAQQFEQKDGMPDTCPVLRDHHGAIGIQSELCQIKKRQENQGCWIDMLLIMKEHAGPQGRKQNVQAEPVHVWIVRMHQKCNHCRNIIGKRHVLGYGHPVHLSTVCHFIADDEDIQLIEKFLADNKRHVKREKGAEEKDSKQYVDPYSGRPFQLTAFCFVGIGIHHERHSSVR